MLTLCLYVCAFMTVYELFCCFCRWSYWRVHSNSLCQRSRLQHSVTNITLFVAFELVLAFTLLFMLCFELCEWRWHRLVRYFLTTDCVASYYLRQEGCVFAGFCLSVCVCVQDNSKSYSWIFLKFWGYVRHGISYKWLNFGGDPAGILDSGSLWNFRYHCVKGGISGTAAKPKMVTPPGE